MIVLMRRTGAQEFMFALHLRTDSKNKPMLAITQNGRCASLLTKKMPASPTATTAHSIDNGTLLS